MCAGVGAGQQYIPALVFQVQVKRWEALVLYGSARKVDGLYLCECRHVYTHNVQVSNRFTLQWEADLKEKTNYAALRCINVSRYICFTDIPALEIQHQQELDSALKWKRSLWGTDKVKRNHNT